jgi:hypothetical protein
MNKLTNQWFHMKKFHFMAWIINFKLILKWELFSKNQFYLRVNFEKLVIWKRIILFSISLDLNSKYFAFIHYLESIEQKKINFFLIDKFELKLLFEFVIKLFSNVIWSDMKINTKKFNFSRWFLTRNQSKS